MKHYALSNLVDDSFALWDPFFDDFFDFPLTRETRRRYIMRVDVREDDKQYHIDIDLPSVKKENLKIELHDGYLTVRVDECHNADDKSGKYLRRERYCGKFSRSFYVGESVTYEDIKASLADGVLTLDINKVEVKTPEKKYIEIQ